MIYGIGIGSYRKKLENWLASDSRKKVLFIEDELFSFDAFLKSPNAESLLSHPRVEFLYAENGIFSNKDRLRLQTFTAYPFEILSLTPYRKRKPEAFHLLRETIIHLHIEQNVFLSEYANAAPSVHENILRNITAAKNTLSGYFLKDAFQDLPAIICGAGPSLNEMAPFLRSHREKALIFAGGRALSVLSDLGIEPHMALGVDPFPEHAETLACNNYFEIPFLYRLRTFHEALSLMHGPHIHMNGGVGYPLISFLEKKLDWHHPSLQEGCNVVNFTLEVAKMAGCRPLILVGCDLAYRNNRAYSPSIPDTLPLPKIDKNTPENFTLNRLYRGEGKGNRSLYTLWKWMEEADWIGTFAEENPDLCLLNASPYGLRIPNVPFLSASEVARSHLQRSFNPGDRVRQAVASLPLLSVDDVMLHHTLTDLKESLERCRQILREEELPLPEEEAAFHYLLDPIALLFDRIEGENPSAEIRQQKRVLLTTMIEKYQRVFSDF